MVTNYQKMRSYMSVFWALLRTDIMILRHMIFDKLLDLSIWAMTFIGVSAYVLPMFGIDRAYGLFLIPGACATGGFFEMFPGIMNLINDFNGERTVAYHFTLPMPSWMVLAKLALFYAINAFILIASLVPLCKILLWNQFDMSLVNYPALLLMISLTSLFFGAFTLWAASFVVNVVKIGSVWMRMIYPLWITGCCQFSWALACKLNVYVGYIVLANPITYVMEGMRGAMGVQGGLPVWLCAMVLAIATAVCFVHSVARLKRRLDFV